MEFCNDRCQDFLAGRFASSRIEFNQLQDLASLLLMILAFHGIVFSTHTHTLTHVSAFLELP